VVIAGVETASLAYIGGMKEGDYLVGIADKDIKWSSHAEVVEKIRSAGNSLKLRLVTPHNNKTKNNFSKAKLHGGLSPTSTTSSSSGLSSAGSSASYPSADDSCGNSPPISEVGSTRGTGLNMPFSLFKKGSKDRKGFSREEIIHDNIIFR